MQMLVLLHKAFPPSSIYESAAAKQSPAPVVSIGVIWGGLIDATVILFSNNTAPSAPLVTANNPVYELKVSL